MLPRFLTKGEVFQDGKFFQILLLSVSFMLVFTAFQTTSMTEQTVLASVKKTDPTFTGDGYVSLCIIYAVFAIGSWIAPSIVAVLGAKWGMVMSASIYLLFIAQFMAPTTTLLYVTSALLGGAASVLWCCQGNFLTLASDPKTISRNSGVFWGINQCSLFFGNLFVFYKFQGKAEIDTETRVFVFAVLTIVAAIGVLSMLLLSNLRDESTENTGGDEDQDVATNPSRISMPQAGEKTDKELEASQNAGSPPVDPNARSESSQFQIAKSALIQALKLFITPNMILLSIASIYTGWCQSFFFGVYPTSVGFTKRFGDDAKRLVGLVGIFTGVGEVIGGSAFGLLGSKTTKKGRSPIVFLGLITHITCFVLVYLNLPERATIEETNDAPIFESPIPWLAIVCAMFMGFGDACYITQLLAIFGSIYADKSAAAFAIFKFTQSAASAIAFMSSSYMGMFSQMVTLFVTSILGCAAFFIVELQTKSSVAEGVENESDASSDGTGETHPVATLKELNNIRDSQQKVV